MQQDTINELINLRAEKKELEIKLAKALTTIQNFFRKHDEQKESLLAIAKKSVYSIDRLCNIISNRKTIEDEELKKVFDFLRGQVLYLKQIIDNRQEENNESKSSD